MSRRESCVVHPSREPLLVIRKWQVEACDGNVCAAALLSFFEYWHNIRLDQSRKSDHSNKVAEHHGDAATQDSSMFQFHSENELHEGILSLYSIRSIREALPVLENKNFVSIHKNPNPRYAFDKTRYFLFNAEAVNNAIRALRPNMLCVEEELPQPIGKIADGEKASPIGNISAPSGDSAAPSGKKAPPITETTSDTTPETTSLEKRQQSPLQAPVDPPLELNGLERFLPGGKCYHDKYAQDFYRQFETLKIAWKRNCPLIDIATEISKAHTWCITGNKIRTRLSVFLNKWMDTAQQIAERNQNVGQQTFLGAGRENPRVLKNVSKEWSQGILDKYGND